MLRRLAITALVCAAAGLLGAPANAARPSWPHSVSSRHFVVHYTSDPLDTAYATAPQASTLAVLGDRAYDAEVGWGFQAPLDDGDGKVDVYIEDLSAFPGVAAFAAADVAAPTSTGYIVFGVASLPLDGEGEIIAHELFHVLTYATWSNFANTDRWLVEGSAEWAAAKVYGFPASMVGGVGPSDLALDCRDSIDGFQMCDPDGYVDGGYSRWPFFQALAARYGSAFLQSVFARGTAGLSATSALAAEIGSRGGSLADVYNDWAVEQMAAGYGIPSLDVHPPTVYATVPTGVASGSLGSRSVSVDHLATRYLEFTRGDGAADHACFAATLTVSVTIPNGVTSRPFIYWNAKGSVPVALAINGSTAAATIPWDTCLWSTNAAYLALPNDTTTVDGADFVVTSSVVVDPNTVAAATAPPTQGTVYGGVSNVPGADVAPEISVFGPLLLRVSTTSPKLRLIVESSGEGKVHALLGSVDLGTSTLRAGNNDVRLVVPKSLLSALRRSSAAGNTLSLTPVSTSGAATGTAVTRSVTVVAAPKAKAKAKKKPKK